MHRTDGRSRRLGERHQVSSGCVHHPLCFRARLPLQNYPIIPMRRLSSPPPFQRAALRVPVAAASVSTHAVSTRAVLTSPARCSSSTSGSGTRASRGMAWRDGGGLSVAQCVPISSPCSLHRTRLASPWLCLMIYHSLLPRSHDRMHMTAGSNLGQAPPVGCRLLVRTWPMCLAGSAPPAYPTPVCPFCHFPCGSLIDSLASHL